MPCVSFLLTRTAADKGIRLIEVVHPEVRSPVMTGQWEARLKRIERGQDGGQRTVCSCTVQFCP